MCNFFNLSYTMKKRTEQELKTLLAAILSDMRRLAYPHSQRQEPEQDGTETSVAMRHVGDWRNREDEEDDDSPIWESRKEYTDKFNRWVEGQSWAAEVECRIDEDEKAWVRFCIRLK